MKEFNGYLLFETSNLFEYRVNNRDRNIGLIAYRYGHLNILPFDTCGNSDESWDHFHSEWIPAAEVGDDTWSGAIESLLARSKDCRANPNHAGPGQWCYECEEVHCITHSAGHQWNDDLSYCIRCGGAST